MTRHNISRQGFLATIAAATVVTAEPLMDKRV